MCVSCTRIIQRSWTLSPSSAVSCCHRSFWFWDYEQNIWNLFIAENVFSDFFSSVFHSFFLSCLLFNWQVLLNGDFSITVYPTNPTDLSSRECLLLSMSPITCEITSIQGCLMSSRHTFLAFHRCPRFQLYLDTLPRILTLKNQSKWYFSLWWQEQLNPWISILYLAHFIYLIDTSRNTSKADKIIRLSEKLAPHMWHVCCCAPCH